VSAGASPPSDAEVLGQLADRFGILAEYIEQNGTLRRTSDASRRLLLQAMDVPCATPAEARRTLQEAKDQAPRVLGCTAVVRPRGARLAVEVPPTSGLGWQLDLQLEDGQLMGGVRRGKGRLPTSLPLPVLPLGYHRAHLHYQVDGAPSQVSQHLIVTPARAYAPPATAKVPRRATGIWANLYTLRNATSWGFGDMGCLKQLCGWAAKQGAAFVGVNPLHALRNGGLDISPYSPISRIYRNMLYVDVNAVPELGGPAGQAMLAEPRTQHALAGLRQASTLHYDGVRRLKLRALKIAHEVFCKQAAAAPRSRRARAYAAFCARGGTALSTFALFAALDVHFCDRGHRGGWPSWPTPYQKPDLPAVQRFAKTHAQAVDLQRFIQFELDQQLQAAGRAAKRAGMAIGLYQDLAVGAAPSGAEPWVYPELFVTRASIGAPPDYYAPQGQNWGLPPMAPHKLAEDGYAFWRNLLRHAFAHSGALRIDHVLGLFRLFWVPQNKPASLGAYVRYPTEDLLGIVALESHRHQAMVIGEDLGTVPPEVPGVLKRWGILSSRVMYFEKGKDGEFAHAKAYPRAALVTATTHDHIPIAGFIRGEDCRLRRQVGHIPTDAALRQALLGRRDELLALWRRIAPRRRTPSTEAAEWIRQIHRFLRRTPSTLVGLSLDDLAAESLPVNIPGVSPDAYPCWARPMGRTLEDLAKDPDCAAAFGGKKN
jgi:4-alpha-glucanotransferase